MLKNPNDRQVAGSKAKRTRRSDPVFMKNVLVDNTTGCWNWVGAVANKKGYGSFFGDRAHRVSYRTFKGEIPSDKHVLHRCDNPSCVNPEHLFLGTNKENIDDKMLKGRFVVPSSMTRTCSCLVCKQEKQVASFTKHFTSCESKNVGKR